MRALGQQRAPFTRALWDLWLARLNALDSPAADRARQGIADFRARLEKRCQGARRDRA